MSVLLYVFIMCPSPISFCVCFVSKCHRGILPAEYESWHRRGRWLLKEGIGRTYRKECVKIILAQLAGGVGNYRNPQGSPRKINFVFYCFCSMAACPQLANLRSRVARKSCSRSRWGNLLDSVKELGNTSSCHLCQAYDSIGYCVLLFISCRFWRIWFAEGYKVCGQHAGSRKSRKMLAVSCGYAAKPTRTLAAGADTRRTAANRPAYNVNPSSTLRLRFSYAKDLPLFIKLILVYDLFPFHVSQANKLRITESDKW
jgi:hypothetical protein